MINLEFRKKITLNKTLVLLFLTVIHKTISLIRACFCGNKQLVTQTSKKRTNTKLFTRLSRTMYTSRLPIVSTNLKHGETALQSFAQAEMLETRHFSILSLEGGWGSEGPRKVLKKLPLKTLFLSTFV